MKERVAITICRQRVAPLFDTSRKVLLIEDHRSEIVFLPDNLMDKCDYLRELKITKLICGAISQTPYNLLQSLNFEIIPFVSAMVDEIVEAINEDKGVDYSFTMPGCQRRRGCNRGVRRLEEGKE